MLGLEAGSVGARGGRALALRSPCVLAAASPPPARQRTTPLRVEPPGDSGGDDDGAAGPPPFSGVATLVPRWLPPPPDLRGAPARSWSPSALAFIGDSVWELYARRRFFAPARLHATYVTKTSMSTRAEAQAGVVAALVAGGSLTPAEVALVKWGRNAHAGKVPTRLRADGRVYRDATSLEVLVGYLYVTDGARLAELMEGIGWEAVSTPPVHGE